MKGQAEQDEFIAENLDDAILFCRIAADVAQKVLGYVLDKPEDLFLALAKAKRDGIVDASGMRDTIASEHGDVAAMQVGVVARNYLNQVYGDELTGTPSTTVGGTPLSYVDTPRGRKAPSTAQELHQRKSEALEIALQDVPKRVRPQGPFPHVICATMGVRGVVPRHQSVSAEVPSVQRNVL